MARTYPYPSGNGKVRLVSTGWLEEHRGDGGLVIIDCQPNVHDYIQEHIPGAVYLSEGVLRSPARGFPSSYAPLLSLQENFRRLGLKKDTPTVVYTGKGVFKGWGDGLEQTMMAYSLAKFGHDSVFVLDGGLDKWKSEERALSQEFPAIEPSDFTVEVRGEYPIGYEAFKATKDSDDVILLDARPSAVYEGQGPWRKPGHIPGAVSLPWASLMHPENPRLLKSEDEIQSILDSRGITPAKTIICSCGTGREATNEFILFKFYLGYPSVRIYEGSFTEWTSHPENPTVTGKEPRMREMAAAAR
jgi:thiosulfate/3-mercaptopyruvate sulfurtransferase